MAEPTYDDLWAYVMQVMNPPKQNVLPADMQQAQSLMRQQWRQNENQTLEQQKNAALEQQTGGLQSWYGSVPYGTQAAIDPTLGGIWRAQAAQKQEQMQRYLQILKLIGAPQ